MKLQCEWVADGDDLWTAQHSWWLSLFVSLTDEGWIWHSHDHDTEDISRSEIPYRTREKAASACEEHFGIRYENTVI